jgi:glucokinase
MKMANYEFGIDLGGTTCKIGLFQGEEMIDKWEIPTDTSDGGKNILRDIADSVKAKIEEKTIAKDDIKGLGIGVPGPVTDDGTVHNCVNLGWGTVNISEKLGELSGYPVKVGNDANVAALGESWMGGGKDYNSVVVVTLGTGIGGGIIINDRIIAGAHGAGGEIGHMLVNPEEELACNCGLHGCIEQYASATGIVRTANRYLDATDTESVLRKEANISAKTVFDAAREGDALALTIVDDVCEKLAKTLARLATVVDPEAFLIGGGVSKAGQILLDHVAEPYKKYAFHACRDTKIGLATLGNDAGMYGAARMVLD